MDTLVKADVFFFVATICLVLLTAIFAMAGVYLIKILKDVREMGKKAKMFQVFIRNLISRL